ncbi:MAG: M24 family metallopeptidase [Planctomycetota bacterium]|jgi:Xaa-Pro aminopeptidase
MAKTARLFWTDTERDADLLYLSGFHAGDPILYLELDGKSALYLNDLEVDRGKKEARVDEVFRLKEISDVVKEKTGTRPGRTAGGVGRCLEVIAKQRGIDSFEVSATFPISLADVLRGLGFGVRWKPAPFVPERARKRPDEINAIRGAIAHTEAAMQAAIDRIAGAEIKGGALYENGQPLTSEMVKQTINGLLAERNCDPLTPIVAGGDQACDPHDRGSGPLPANSPIILDIFPRDKASGYCGDMTRTVVRGKATDEQKAIFEAVKESKAAAEAATKAGVSGRDVHAAVKKVFDDRGYETGQKNGRMVGFFHGTGHGLGLDVHEYPGVGEADHTLEEGHVITIEPGLYYPGIGGVRIEDDVLVTKDGHENLCTMDAVFEI